MSLYMFYQEVEKGKWLPALASERERLIQTKKPALVSALDVDSSFDHDLTLEETRALRYSGPMYFDWDAEDLEEATQQYQKFLTNLKAKGVNLDMLRLYATGKKGYHLEIPMPVFMGKPPANGTLFLPDMYREVAHSLFVETLDLRVYTARRGRMWRCPNVLRDNGKYKVQITPEEAFSMDTEKYMQICSVPRLALPTEPPALNAELGLLFAQARDKVEAGAAKKKSKKQASDQLEKFKGQWPDTLQNIFTGAVVKPGVGWNHISLQLCIVASELGKSEEDLLADAAPLINSHESDSTRYNTPAKRTADLRDMHRYVVGNPCYEYSPGGILSLLLPEVRANADISFGDWQPDETPSEPVINEDGTVQEPPEPEETGPIKVDRSGIFVRCDTGYNKVSDIGIRKAKALRTLEGASLGYEVEVFHKSIPIGKHMLPMDKLLSRSAFQAYCSQWSASMTASDIQTTKIMDILSSRAKANNDVTYVVNREGVDLIVKQGSKSIDDFEIVFSTPDKVVGNKGGVYTFKSTMDKEGAFKSDLLDSPNLSTDDEELIDNLLKINSNRSLSKLLGWFCVVPMTQILRRFYKQFPSIQLFGQSGSGKSKTSSLLNHMWYFMQDPQQIQTSGTTKYAMMAKVASSASMPVIFDEVKKRELSVDISNYLLNILRCNYDGLSISRGGLSKDAGAKEVITTTYGNVGPLAFVGESVENQSAMLERCLVVAMSKSDRYGRDGYYHHVRGRATELSKLGYALMTRTMASDLTQVRSDFETVFKEVKTAIGPTAEEFERPCYNLACASYGLKLLKDTLHDVFGERFDARLDELRCALTDASADSIPRNMAETSRVLDVMAILSRNQDAQYQIVQGEDYTIAADGRTMDLKLRTAFAKYAKWQRSLGQELLFDNESAFIAAMLNYAGVIKKACPENLQLFDSPRAVIYRLSLDYLDKEEVDAFKS